MAKDKFKQMQQGRGSSFQDMVQQAATVAAIEKQAEQPAVKQEAVQKGVDNPSPSFVQSKIQEQRFMRLPNPQIPITEYNLVTRYTEQFPNMTRQDFVELAIIEKLHNENLMADDDFTIRSIEIRNRPPRGHRKGTKTPPAK